MHCACAGYDPTCDATLVNEFSSAAFRFGHSLLQPQYVRMDPSYRPVEPAVRLRDHFFNSDIILAAGMVDEIVRGLIATPMQTLDQFVTSEVTNHLFETRRVPFSGFDLVAINMQRGEGVEAAARNDVDSISLRHKFNRIHVVWICVDEFRFPTCGALNRPQPATTGCPVTTTTASCAT